MLYKVLLATHGGSAMAVNESVLGHGFVADNESDKLMGDPKADLERLRRRYRRLFIFDQIVWVLYGVSAVLPVWYLLAYPGNRLFNASVCILILSVAGLGHWSNRMLLRNNPNGKTAGYVATTLLFVSRIGIFLYVIAWATHLHSIDWSDIWFGDVGIAISWVLTLVGFYRFVYHISAHFYMKLFIGKTERDGRTERGDFVAIPSRAPQVPGR